MSLSVPTDPPTPLASAPALPHLSRGVKVKACFRYSSLVLPSLWPLTSRRYSVLCRSIACSTAEQVLGLSVVCESREASRMKQSKCQR